MRFSFLSAMIRGRPMRTRLIVSFSVPVVALCVLMMGLLYRVVAEKNRSAMMFSADQSFEQAHSYTVSHIGTMDFVSDQIYYNGDLQRILSSNEFHGGRDIAVQYREYLKLDRVFTSAEMSGAIYQAKIFVRDDINYINDYHFSREHDLIASQDYAGLVAAMLNAKVYYTGVRDVQLPGHKAERIISLLRMIRKTDGSSENLAVEQVSIREDTLADLLIKSNITRTGLVYLVNLRGELLSASNRPQAEWMLQSGSLPMYGDAHDWEKVSIDATEYYVKKAAVPKAEWMLIALIPHSEILEYGEDIRTLSVFLTLGTVLAIFVVSYVLANNYTKRLSQLRSSIHRVQEGDLFVAMPHTENDELGQLFKSFSRMAERLRGLMEQQYTSGQAVKSAELRALQAQINPHLLYNTLDLINWEAFEHDAPQIAEIARSLAKFYRRSLNGGRQTVTIQEEIGHVESYVRIENYHFDGAISLQVQMEEQIGELACINIILQPFVENSIVHGIAKNPQISQCNIRIFARRDGKDIVLTVADDGNGMTQAQIKNILQADNQSHGYGVKNINNRIKLCYGDEYGIWYISSPGEGTTVNVRIPALTKEQLEKWLDKPGVQTV